jgi:hypothetical protein
MKRLVFSFAAAVLLLCAPGTATAQDKAATPKAVSISGKVSDDGQTLVAENSQVWSVTNPGSLAGREGRHVKVKCRLSPGSHEIRVLSVRSVNAQATYVANKGDSAFRR